MTTVTKVTSHNRSSRERKVRGVIYVNVKNETIMQNLMERKSRPHAEYRKLMPAAFEQMKADGLLPPNVEAKDVKMVWSQYAGCSCPCSPGFVVTSHHLHRKDVWVTIE